MAIGGRMKNGLLGRLRPEGFSLVSVMITMAIASVLILGTMTAVNHSLKSSRNVTLSTEFNNLSSGISLYLNDEERCTSVVAPNGPVIPFDPKGTPAASLAKFGTLADTNQPRNGLKIAKMSFENPVALSPTTYLGVPYSKYEVTFSIEVEKQGEFMGAGQLRKESQVFLLISQDSKIARCYGTISRTAMKEELCGDLGGAIDPNTAKCVITVQNPGPGNPPGGGGGPKSVGNISLDAAVIDTSLTNINDTSGLTGASR